jgi:quinol monooxygenase YgiN
LKNGITATTVQPFTSLGNKMINVIAFISVKASERDAFIEIFKANIPKVLKEEGCIEYSATVDFQTEIPIQETNANVVTVIEKWESLPHLEAHFTASHMLEYKSKVEGMVEDVSLKILEDA